LRSPANSSVGALEVWRDVKESAWSLPGGALRRRGHRAQRRRYARVSLSYRDSEELVADRDLSVDHDTIWRWAQPYAPEFDSGVDKTYVCIVRWWVYLYRTMASIGPRLDFCVSGNRHATAAKRIFCMGLAVGNHPLPARHQCRRQSVISEGGEGVRTGTDARWRCLCRTCPYLSDIIVQDDRPRKPRISAEQGFRPF